MLDRRRTLRTPDDLAASGLLSPAQVPALNAVAARYAVALTPALADLIDPDDPDDPIARQFVPSEAELESRAGELSDPIGDARHSPVEGIVHRYPDRVLLKLTHVCPVYCRFCFRREMVGPGEDQMLSAGALDAALAYIAAHPEIWEVVLTGGDPFMLSPRRLKEVSARLSAIAHVKVLRWHTRMPIADPERVSGELVRALACPKAVYVAVHVNHPRELSEPARAACTRLIDAGIPLLSQSVLLKGVNDDAGTLEALMRALVEARIKPYYLHHADLAPGTAHFRTAIAEGQALMRALKARASGLCLPEYVLDIPGGYAKARLGPDDLEETEAGHRLRDAQGEWHAYPGKTSKY
jgi:lysine 2,3-aminomutase